MDYSRIEDEGGDDCEEEDAEVFAEEIVDPQKVAQELKELECFLVVFVPSLMSSAWLFADFFSYAMLGACASFFACTMPSFHLSIEATRSAVTLLFFLLSNYLDAHARSACAKSTAFSWIIFAMITAYNAVLASEPSRLLISSLYAGIFAMQTGLFYYTNTRLCKPPADLHAKQRVIAGCCCCVALSFAVYIYLYSSIPDYQIKKTDNL